MSGTQTSTSLPIPTLIIPMPSPNDTIIGGINGSIIDSAGNVWTINSGGQVAVDGAVDTTTKNVIELAYTNGTILQENSSQLWWAKTQPNASWTPSGGPLPPAPSPALPPGVTYLPGVGGPTGETAISGPTGSIMDTASPPARSWTRPATSGRSPPADRLQSTA